VVVNAREPLTLCSPTAGVSRRCIAPFRPDVEEVRMLRIIESKTNCGSTNAYTAELADGGPVEFASCRQHMTSGGETWAMLISALTGCPVGCSVCTAAATPYRPLSSGEIMAQIEHLIAKLAPDPAQFAARLKLYFSQTGDPALNPAVLDVLLELPLRFMVSDLTPCISSTAPRGCEAFFQNLLEIKHALYCRGRFLMQFALHTTDEAARGRMLAMPALSFREIATYGNRFFTPGDRRIALNLAAAQGVTLNPSRLLDTFSPAIFAVKLAIPPAPTADRRAPLDPAACEGVADSFRHVGFETFISYIGIATGKTAGAMASQPFETALAGKA
jgi:23S rRNA (adenine2503-C2)-methyltransferase